MASTGSTQAITDEHLDDAALTLAAAFATDPMFRWMARDRRKFAGGLRHTFRAVLRAEMRSDAPLFITAGGRSAAIWHDIDKWKPSPLNSLRVVPGFIRGFGLRPDRLLRMQSVLDKAHPAEPHFHLAFIGTRPEEQGTGLGAQVMQPMIERCDREGVGAYLESSNPRNEAFYARQGFVVTGNIDVPPGAPPMTAMWRKPR